MRDENIGLGKLNLFIFHFGHRLILLDHEVNFFMDVL